MALTDGMVGILAILGLFYWKLYNHPVRWVRMVGCIAIIIVSGAFGLVEDTAIMYVIFLGNLIVAGLKFIEDVGQILP